MRSALLTGGAGFIGSNLLDSLLSDNWSVTVVDNFDPFYSEELKIENIARHHANPLFKLVRADIRDAAQMAREIGSPPDVVVHLAAKAGVRGSILDPAGYSEVNVGGTQQVLELAARLGVRQFVFASSSSVYGVNQAVPWSESDHGLQPISPYAATKVSGELLGHVYSHLYPLRFVALRLFTVFGPRQRPDLAICKFLRLMCAGEPIPVYGDGTALRDFTYVKDVVAGIRRAMDYCGTEYEVFNIGGSQAISVSAMINTLEEVTGIPARIKWLDAEPGDVPQTLADVRKAREFLGYEPKTPFRDGLIRYWKWVCRLPKDQRLLPEPRAALAKGAVL